MARRARINVRGADAWGELAETVEAWGFRAMQERATFMDRVEVARAWYEQEYLPVVSMLREADLIGEGTETEAYMRVACKRYQLMRTHEWSEEIVAQLARDMR